MKLPVNQVLKDHLRDIVIFEENESINGRGIVIKSNTNEREISVVIRPLSHDKKIFDPNGVYTNNDIKVFTTERLKINGTRLKYDDKTYTIMEEKNNKFNGDYYTYIAKCDG